MSGLMYPYVHVFGFCLSMGDSSLLRECGGVTRVRGLSMVRYKCDEVGLPLTRPRTVVGNVTGGRRSGC